MRTYDSKPFRAGQALGLLALASVAHAQGLSIAVRTSAALTSIGNQFGINDSGVVAFTGADAQGNRAFVVSPQGVVTAITFTSPNRFFDGAAINNMPVPLVATRDRVTGSPPFFFVRAWSSDGAQARTTIGRSPDHFDSAQLFVDINDSGVVVFPGLVNGSTSTRLFAGTAEPPTPLATFPGIVLLRPHISNNNRIVIRDNQNQVIVYPYPSGGSETIASIASGFSSLGEEPSISANGSVVSFSGDRGSGTGVFLSWAGPQGRVITRLAGEGSDAFSSIVLGQRVSVHSRGSPGSSQRATAMFVGTMGGVQGVYQARAVATVSPEGVMTVEVRPATRVAQIGDTIDGSVISAVSLSDSANNRGTMVFRATFADNSAALVRVASFKEIDTREHVATPPEVANGVLHHTDQFRLPHSTPPAAPDPDDRTVLRRGQYADIDIEVYAPFGEQQGSLSLQGVHTFDDGVSEVTIEIPLLTQPATPTQWGCQIRSWRDGPLRPGDPTTPATRVARVRLYIPSIASVGEYTFFAVARNPSGDIVSEIQFPKPVAILFNPWQSQDAVYLSAPAERTEYVLNEQGLIWSGTARDNSPAPWDYAQFSEDVLLGTLALLNDSRNGQHLTAEQRTDPTHVSRWLSERVDRFDGGVLLGCWPDAERDITCTDYPSWNRWTGSEAIFADYRNQGLAAYGQCWVFAGSLTSSLRAIGVPARPVTNFESGHDSSMPPDQVIERCRYFDSEGNRWRVRGESFWNFHVWCEAWMKRSDLSGRDGWQAVDATPQERSDGFYQLGPTPVSAVREGAPEPYDGGFVLSEVDARIQDMEERGGVCAPIAPANTTRIGRRISTKTVGASTRTDITASYKTPETTPDPFGMEEVTVAAPSSSPLGAAIHAEVTIHNAEAQPRDFSCYILLRAIAQNGNEIGVVVGPRTDSVTIPAGGEVTVGSDAPWALIAPWIGATEFVEFDVVVTRVHDERRWFLQRVVVVRGLPVSVALKPGQRISLGADAIATVMYSNPLTAPLEDAAITIAGGSGLPIDGTALREVILLGTVPAGASGVISRTVTASLEGEQAFVAHFLADGVVPGDGFAAITVVGCDADQNGDGEVTSQDFFDFLTAFFTEAPAADFNGDGAINSQDFFDFLAAFFAGC